MDNGYHLQIWSSEKTYYFQIAAAPSPEPAAVNHQLIMSTLHPHYESHVIKWSELSGYDNQQHGLKTCIYIYLYVFERGAGALQGSAPALPPTTTTGGGLRSAGENIIVIMWSRAENECVITKSVRDPTSLTPTWTHNTTEHKVQTNIYTYCINLSIELISGFTLVTYCVRNRPYIYR
jgi:hypothetical protein